MEVTSLKSHSEGALSQLTVLIGFETPIEHYTLLKQAGAEVLVYPKLSIEAPESFATLDEAIEDLYGYDWVVFIKSHTVTCFLDRFRELGHEISELDSLRVCALGEKTVEVLEESQVHVDLVPAQFDAQAVVTALATYAGGGSALRGLNLLLPQAVIGRGYLKDDLADAGARADVVAAYRTVAPGASGLNRLQTLILNGGVDCLLFRDSIDVHNFAALFDVNDLSRLLKHVRVFCLETSAAEAAAQLGVQDVIKPTEQSFPQLIRAIASRFSR